MQIIWNRELKKVAAAFLAVFAAGVLTVNFFGGMFSNHLRMEYNSFLAAMLGNVMKAYPDVAEEELIQILNDGGAEDRENTGAAILAHYGIFQDYGSESFGRLERRLHILRMFANIFLILILGLCVILTFGYLRKRQQKIFAFEAYMEALNRKGYKIDIEDNTDDELSGLRNEIYKLTVFLNEQAAFAVTQKRALADSVANISHQLKTPLTSITVLMDNLSENMDMDEITRKHFMSEIMRQLMGMSWLIATMLKISRLDAGVVELEPEWLGVRQLVKEALQKIEIAAEWKEITFSLDVPEKAELFADKKWTAEALMNIVKNAIEHSPAGSVVEISGEENDVYTQITVRDHGAGITKEEREKLFRRFYNGGSAKEDSIGIGLALAKEIVEKQNGYISVDSKMGKGTAFVLQFIKQ